jgi:cytidylate kinase
LGVAFYDKAVIKALEEKYHLTVEEIERLKGQKNNWWSEFKRVLSAGNAFVIAPYNDMSVEAESDIPTTEAMFCAEKEILKGIVEHESCVIAGRCGFHVMREHPNHLSVMIQAPMEQRIQRVMTKQGLSHEEAEKAIHRVDKMRENYVTKYTKTSRYDTRNYDLVISMAGKTEDDAVALIMNYKISTESQIPHVSRRRGMLQLEKQRSTIFLNH